MVVENNETFYVDDLAVATRKNYKEENHVDYSKQGKGLKNKMAVKVRTGLKTKVELVDLTSAPSGE